MSAFDPPMLDVEHDDPVAVLDLYESHGWGDGLPLVAPTRARVDDMLAAIERRSELLKEVF